MKISDMARHVSYSLCYFMVLFGWMVFMICFQQYDKVKTAIHCITVENCNLFQVAAISEQASESSGEPANSGENASNLLGWKSFDMRAVVAATEDLLLFILSEKGLRVRVFLLQDIIQAADIFLQAEVCILGDETKEMDRPESEVCLPSYSFICH